jgi:hypothetical protein
MSNIAKPLEDDEVEEVDEDDSSVDETKKTVSGFTPTQRVSWPWGSAKPLNEPETALDSAKGTRGESGRINRTLGNQEGAEKARQDDHRADSVVGDSHRGSFEAKLASGFARQAGKHTAYSGPLTRGGRLKVFDEEVSAEELEEWGDRAGEAIELAKKLFHGRTATILDGRLINPLRGQPRRSVEDLAAQFGIKAKQVYKIEDVAKRRLLAALKQQPEDSPREWEWDLVFAGEAWTEVPPPGPRFVVLGSNLKIAADGKLWVREQRWHRIRKPKKPTKESR